MLIAVRVYGCQLDIDMSEGYMLIGLIGVRGIILLYG